MEHRNPYKAAEARARAVRDFRIHLALFIPIGLALVLLDTFTTPATSWVSWLVAVWAFGVLLHGLSLLNPIQRLSRFWDKDRLQDRFRH